MTDQEFWDLAFVSVCAFRMHPGSVPPGETLDEDELNEVDFAASVANEMLHIRRITWAGQPQQQLSEADLLARAALVPQIDGTLK